MSRPTQHFTQGEAIVVEGAVGDQTFRILSGEVLVCKRNNTGQLLPIARLGSGELFGEMYLFEDNLARTASVVATSNDVIVEVLHQHEMQQTLSRTSPGLKSILEGMNCRLRRITNSCVDAQSGQAPTMTRLPDGKLSHGTLRVSGNKLGGNHMGM